MAVAHVDPAEPDNAAPTRAGGKRKSRVENRLVMLMHLAEELSVRSGARIRSSEIGRHLPIIRPELADRPRSRGDCIDVPRPCPYVACSQNLYLEARDDTGNIQRAFADREPGEMQWSCALDEAAKGGLTLEETARRLGITRERARQIEERAVSKMKRATGHDLGLPVERGEGYDVRVPRRR